MLGATSFIGFPRRSSTRRAGLLGNFLDRPGLSLLLFFLEFVFEGGLIPRHYFFEHFGSVTPGKSEPRAADASDRPKADQIVGGIADDRLIEIPNLDFDVFRRIGDRAQIA